MNQITMLDYEFNSNGNMWGAIYDSRYDNEMRQDIILAEIADIIESKTSEMPTPAKSKNFLLLRRERTKGLLNTVVILKPNTKTKGTEVVTAFPEIATNHTTRAKLLEVNEYKGGFEGRLKIEVVGEGEERRRDQLDFFDTRYIENCDMYVIGETYDFHLGALVGKITHRAPGMLNIPINTKIRQKVSVELGEPFEQKTLSTKDMFALNELYDDNPEIFSTYFKFDGLHGKSFRYPYLDKKEEMYLFEIRAKLLDEDVVRFTIPAIMTDGVIAQSYKEDRYNSRRKLEFIPGEPIDVTATLVGYLAD